MIAHPLVKLGSLTKIRTGKLDANASSENGEYPFFTCARKPLRISSYTYDCECILVAGNGDLNVKHYKGKFDAYQRTYIIEAADSSNDELHLRYLYHFMECYLETLREQSIGGIIKYIKLGNLTDAEVPLPPLSEQKRIAGILDAADRLRAKRRAALAQLDTLLQSTFLDLFGDPVTNPKGWEVVNSSHLFSVPPRIGTTTPANGSGHIVVRVGEVGSSIIKFEKCGRVEISEKDFNKYKLEVGDTVIARAIGSKNQLGKASLFLGFPEHVVIDSHVMRIRPDQSKCDPTWWYSLLSSDRGKIILQQAGGATAVQFNINAKQASSLKIPLPPLPLQQRFAAIVEQVEAQKTRMRTQLTELDTLFAALQQRAFNGEL